MKHFLLALCLLFEVTVFAGEAGWVLLPVPQNDASRWAPSTIEAEHALSEVKEYVEQQSANQKEDRFRRELAFILSHWDLYYCQVIGEINPRGRSVVLNFFSRRAAYAWGFDWRKDEVNVDGGGAEFFRVCYDIEGGTFQEIRVNAQE